MKWEAASGPSAGRSSGYSRDDLLRMQQDAEARVREMQRRSREALHTSRMSAAARHQLMEEPSSPSGGEAARNTQANNPHPQPRQNPPSSASRHNGTGFSQPQPQQKKDWEHQMEHLLETLQSPPSPQRRDTVSRVLQAMNLDSERILLLALLVLLYNEGADYTLLLAMIYLFF